MNFFAAITIDGSEITAPAEAAVDAAIPVVVLFLAGTAAFMFLFIWLKNLIREKTR